MLFNAKKAIWQSYLLASLLMNSNIFCTNRAFFNCQVNKQVTITSLISAFADVQNLPGSELNEAYQILDNLMDTYPLLSSIIIRQGRHFLHVNIFAGSAQNNAQNKTALVNALLPKEQSW